MLTGLTSKASKGVIMNPAASKLILGCLLIVAFAIGACSPATKEPSEQFEFEFRYGVGAKNVLNTFDGTFTKDMVVDKPIVITLKLSKKQLRTIQNKMLEIDFFKYPDTFNSRPFAFAFGEREPFESFYFKVKSGSRTKELFWEDKHINDSKRVAKLRELIRLIKGIIQNSPEYKMLPEPQGAYM